MASEAGEAGARGSGSRRVRLDPERIVDALLELARREPHERLTFKRIGEELGVDATAMYRHFRNREAMTQAALDRLNRLSVEAGQAVPGGWRARLEAHLLATAELYLTYPALGAEGAVIDPAGPGDAAAVEFLLEVLHEAGLEGGALVRAYAAVSGFALSFSAAMAHEVMRGGEEEAGSEPWITSFGSAHLPDYPLLDANRDALFALSGMDVYRAGIAALLDSVERQGIERAEADR